MANRTISIVGGSWNTVGAWLEAAVPLASDDVIATAASGNLTVTAASVCRSMVLTSYVGTISGSGDVSIGDASGGALTLAGTLSGTWTVALVSTSNNGGAGWSITSNGKNLVGNVTFNGVGGSWKLADAFSATSKTLTLTNGTFNTNAQSITAGAVASNNSNTRVLTITNSTLTLNVGATAWDMTTVTGLTFTATGSTISMGNSFAQFIGGGLSYGTVNYTNLSAAGFSGGMSGTNTFVNLGVAQTGANLTNTGLGLSNDITVTGTLTLTGFTIQGNSRILLRSTTAGTQRTIAMAGAAVVISGDCIIRDINITGTPSWTNAGSSFVGDGGGNSSIVTTNRTSPTTQHFTNTAGGNWSVTASWTSRVPLPQDTAVLDAAFVATPTITLNMTELGGDFVMTGATGTPTISFSTTVNFYGSITLISGMVVSGTSSSNWLGRSSHTITSATQNFTGPINVVGLGGTYTLQDAFSCNTDSANGVVTVALGTLNTNNASMSVGQMVVNNTASAGLTLGTSTVTLLRTGAVSVWSMNGIGVVSAASATIVIGAASASARTFAGAANTYGTLTYTVAGSTGGLTLTGANTFTTINFTDASNARTLTFPASTTTHFTNLNANGTAGKLISLISSTGGTAATLTKDGNGLYSGDFLSVKDITAAGIINFFAGANSTNVSGNTNWTFTIPPVVMFERTRPYSGKRPPYIHRARIRNHIPGIPSPGSGGVSLIKQPRRARGWPPPRGHTFSPKLLQFNPRFIFPGNVSTARTLRGRQPPRGHSFMPVPPQETAADLGVIEPTRGVLDDSGRKRGVLTS